MGGALEAGLDEEVVYVLRMAGDPAGTRRDIKGATADEKKYGFVKPSIGALMADPNFDAWWSNALKHQAVNQATHKQGVASQPVSEPGPGPAPMPATPGVESFHGQPHRYLLMKLRLTKAKGLGQWMTLGVQIVFYPALLTRTE